MNNMKPYVHDFFVGLENGRLPGQRCRHCGRVRLALVPVCDRCKRREMEEIELRKAGTLTNFSVRQHWELENQYWDEFPEGVATGCVTLADGPELWCAVDGIDLHQPEQDWNRLPLAVEIEIRRVGGNRVPVAVVRRGAGETGPETPCADSAQ